VKSGDSISRVANRTKVPVEQLVYLNRLDGRYLQPNQRLLAPKSSFRLVIQQKAQRVVLFNGDRFFRQYPAAVWPGTGQKQVILPKASGRVTEKRAIDSTGSVTPGQLRYRDAAHMILVSIPGHSLYTQPEDPKVIAQRPPGGGIGLKPEHMGEIAILLPAGAPVSIE
jgi:LysM repeat protein